MKKVCIVTNHLQSGDGVCRAVINFANTLAELGKYDITLFVLFKFDERYLALFDKKIKTKHVFKIPCFKGLDRITSWWPPKLLYKKITKNEKFDIEIGFCWKNPTIAISNSINKEAKHLIYTHGYSEGSKYYSKADMIVAISSENVKRISEDINHSVPVVRFSNIFDEKGIMLQSEAAATISKSKTKPLFITVGRLSSEKGYMRMLEAALKLTNEGYRFNVWVVGDGPEKDIMNKYIIDNGLTRVVTMLGNQMNPYPYIKQADTLICSSFTEGYSTVCVESCILEVPVLTTKISGASDIIGDAEAGKIVDNSLDGIYEGMKYILENPEKVKSWKEKLKTSKVKFYKESRKKDLDNLLIKLEELPNK